MYLKIRFVVGLTGQFYATNKKKRIFYLQEKKFGNFLYKYYKFGTDRNSSM